MPYFTRGWYKVGSRPTRKYICNPHQKTCVFGAIGYRKRYTKLTETINAVKYMSFLKILKKHHDKLCIIGDNAPWHGPEDSKRASKAVKKYIRDNAIVYIQTPPYSPETNPIEPYWKNVKGWIGTKPWSSHDELNAILRSALRRDFLMPDISEY
jgi:transposase